jgi:hypothetical protein
MNKAHPQSTSEADDELLVSYLDNELDGAERSRVERRLATDDIFRSRMISLQQSWDLLDELPRAETNSELTASTMSMAVREAISDSTTVRQLRTTSRRKILFQVASVVGALVVGFALIAIPARVRDARMLADLPVIQDLDLYRYADSVEFIRRLRKEQILPVEKRPSVEVSNIPKSLEARNAKKIPEIRETLREFPNELRNQLSQGRDQFHALPREEQARFRSLHQQFSQQPDFDQLRETLVAYEQFLAELTPLQRVTLAQKTPDARIRDISRELQSQKDAPPRGRPTGWRRDDFVVIMRWVGNYVNTHEKELLELLKEEDKPPFIESDPRRSFRKIEAIVKLVASDREGKIALPEPTEAEKKQLLEALSPRAAEDIARRTRENDNNMSLVIRGWFQDTLRYRLNGPPFRSYDRNWRSGEPRGPVDPRRGPPGEFPPPPHPRSPSPDDGGQGREKTGYDLPR